MHGIEHGMEHGMDYGMEWDMEIFNRHTEQGTEIHYVPTIQHMAIIGTEVSESE